MESNKTQIADWLDTPSSSPAGNTARKPPEAGTRTKNSTLLNRAAVKRFILDSVKTLRPHWDCTRVSDEALADIEAAVRTKITGLVQGHPTKGKTFRP